MHFNKVNWYEIIELSYLEDLKTLFEESQRMWKSNLNAIEEVVDRLNENDKDEYIDFHYDTIVQMRETLPRITNNSILTNIYSFFEANFFDFYNEVRSKFSSDINAKYLEDKLKYLNESFEKEIVSEDEIIQLDFIRDLRNRIMHSKGIIEDSYTTLIIKIEECPLIKRTEKNELILSNEFINNTFELVKNVLLNININVKKLK